MFRIEGENSSKKKIGDDKGGDGDGVAECKHESSVAVASNVLNPVGHPSPQSWAVRITIRGCCRM
jgi:hypothetical protein